jgi:tripartite-type tricarboxylate transporter receptor subunit TctC
VPAILGHVKSGRLRPIAVVGARRSELMPEVPTMKEAGVEGVEMPVWYALLAPAGTPREIIDALHGAVVRAVQDPDFRRRLQEQGTDPVANTPEEFAKMLREDIARYAEAVKLSGAKPE